MRTIRVQEEARGPACVRLGLEKGRFSAKGEKLGRARVAAVFSLFS